MSNISSDTIRMLCIELCVCWFDSAKMLCRCYRKYFMTETVCVLLLVLVVYFLFDIMARPNQNKMQPRSDDCIYVYQDRHQMSDRHVQSRDPHRIQKTRGFVDGSQACIHLKMDKGEPIMMKYVHKHGRVSFEDFQPDWVFVDNGTLRHDNSAVNKHGVFFTCDYFPLLRGPGDYNISYSDPVRIDRSSFPMISNFFKIKCQSRSQTSRYENIQAGIFQNKTVFERLKVLKPPVGGLGMSVAVSVFDSMSRMSWLRRMPRTRSFVVNKLRAIELIRVQHCMGRNHRSHDSLTNRETGSGTP